MTTQQTAADAFAAVKARIDANLAALQARSDNHFSLSPDRVHWGHVGSLQQVSADLSKIEAFLSGKG